MPKATSLEGRRFGRLLVIHEAPPRMSSGHIRRYWSCICDCGATKEIYQSSLQQGCTLSCGCLNKEQTKSRATKHGHQAGYEKSPEYSSWDGMIQRCTNPKTPSWPNYGERGITVCPAWLSFEQFYADMGPRPTGTSLERRQNDRGYEPENCYWATPAQQARNKRSNNLVTYNGEVMTVVDACALSGVSTSTVYRRRERGEPKNEWFRPTQPGRSISTSAP